MSLDWPSKAKQKKLNEFIGSSQTNPFVSIKYSTKDSLDDFVGRREELTLFKEYIIEVSQKADSKGIRLQGRAGVGKSTLFNYLKKMIETERRENPTVAEYLSSQYDIFSVYMVAPDNILSFGDIWKKLMDAMKGTFEGNLNITELYFPNFILLTLLEFLIKKYPKEALNEFWGKKYSRINLKKFNLSDLHKWITEDNDIPGLITRIQEFIKKYRVDLIKELKFHCDGHQYTISQTDYAQILNLFRVFDWDDAYSSTILNLSPERFPNQDSIINFYNDLFRYYACIKKKQPILLLGIDDFARGPSIDQDLYYTDLAKLLTRLRDSLDFTLFVFISTTGDWMDYDNVVNLQTDLAGQLKGFMETMYLSHLTEKDVIQIFKNRMNSFWDRAHHLRPSEEPSYPFSDSFFSYLYRANGKDLRETIKLLGGIWRKNKIQEKFPNVVSDFDAIRVCHQSDFIPTPISNPQEFELDIIKKYFEKSNDFHDNRKRSEMVEKGLEQAFKALQPQYPAITRVLNNRVIKINNKKRKPDVVLKLHQNRAKFLERTIEFQVKMYSPNNRIEKSKIQSSIDLFNLGYTDVLYFIITGDGFDQNGQAQVDKLREEYPTRVFCPVLSQRQIEYLYFITSFEEIMNKPLDQHPDGFEAAELAINQILGQKFTLFLQDVERLESRDKKYHTTLIEEPIKKEIKKKDLSSFTTTEIPKKSTKKTAKKKSEQKPQKDPRTQEVSLFEKLEQIFPTISVWKPFTMELYGLSDYLQGREGSKYSRQFAVDTVIRNIIDTNVELSNSNFKSLVKGLIQENLIEKKSSTSSLYKLSTTAESLFVEIWKERKIEKNH